MRANVKRLREHQNLGYIQLSRELDEVGRSIPDLGLRRIEAGDRRVDVDDLMALAVALGVSPATLLMPAVHSVGPQDHVESTAVTFPILARQLWGWLTARRPLGRQNLFSFAEQSWPGWVQEELTAQVTAARKALDERVGGEEALSGDD